MCCHGCRHSPRHIAQFTKLSEAEKKNFELSDQTREMRGELLEKKMFSRLKDIFKDKRSDSVARSRVTCSWRKERSQAGK